MREMPELTGFRKVGDIDESVWDKFGVGIPDDLREFSRKYGQGFYAKDYLRFVDPWWAYQMLGDALPDPKLVPFAFTGMGDVVVWDAESSQYFVLHYRNATVKGLMPSWTLNLVAFEEDAELYLKKEFHWKPFPSGVKRHGVPAFDECFTFVPSPLLGGSGKVDTLSIVKTVENAGILSQLGDIQYFFYRLREFAKTLDTDD